MIVRQFLHRDPVVAISYLVGCGGKQECAVIDPTDPVEVYMHAAAELGSRIKFVIDTHIHADHLSTGRALAARAAAEYVLHSGAETGYPFHGVSDGDRLELGNVVMEVWHVPGHTPEHIALLVTDRTRGSEPWLVMTGHTLMVGDMGRTELATSAEEGARALFESARRLGGLPDFVQVMPGAFSGSVCGRGLSGTPLSTIGFERRYNRAFAIADQDTFIEFMLGEVPPALPRARETRALNAALQEATS